MFGGEGTENLEDPLDRQLRLHREREIASKPKAQLTTVIQELPELPNQTWKDHVLEPDRKPIDLCVYQPGQIWWVKFPGATALTKVKITEVTLKTVELRLPYGATSRYSRTDIEFVEMVSP